MSLAATLTLTTVGVFNQSGNYVDSPRLIYYDTRYYFGHHDYLYPYGVIAIAVYIVAIVLPFLLLGGLDFVNWLIGLEKCVLIRRFWPSLKINSFLGAMCDCYRPNRRYFVGTNGFRILLRTTRTSPVPVAVVLLNGYSGCSDATL